MSGSSSSEITSRIPSSASVASTSAQSDNQISFKKPIKIKNELNEKRRNALKDYYKLKQQQQILQKETESLAKKVEVPSRNFNDDEDNDNLEEELKKDQALSDIDLINSEFKDILKDTNKLTSSINFINSSIKSIIHNNYYELIRLNDFLKELNDIDSSIGQKTAQSSRRNTLLESFTSSKPAEDMKSETLETKNDFQKLTDLMIKIEQLDKNNYTSPKKEHQPTISVSITNILNSHVENKDSIKLQLRPLIDTIKKANGQESLIRQLENILHKL